MAKHLLFGDADSERWRLPDDVDIEAVRDTIEEALRLGSAVRVQVEDGHGHDRGDLLLNGRVVPYVVIFGD
jgi:hypothetical protein